MFIARFPATRIAFVQSFEAVSFTGAEISGAAARIEPAKGPNLVDSKLLISTEGEPVSEWQDNSKIRTAKMHKSKAKRCFRINKSAQKRAKNKPKQTYRSQISIQAKSFRINKAS